MRKLPSVLLLAGISTAAFAQYKAEPGSAPPADVDPAIAAVLTKPGIKVSGPSGVYCEIWLRSNLPTGPKSTEDAVSLPMIPQGSLLGVIQFPGRGNDRRGQALKPGTYTMRYGNYPITGDHQGAAPQRDFMVLVPAAEDKDPNSTPAFDALMVMSRKASGTPHPAVLSFWAGSADKADNSVSKEGERDWVVNSKIGSQPITLIVVGRAEG